MELVLNEQKGKVREGYKRTVNGDIIPLDWEDITVQDLMSFSGGSQPPRETFIFKPKEGYVRLLQIRDYKSDRFETYIPLHLARKFCNKNDIMIGRYGPPVFQILRGLEGAYNVALIKVLPQAKLDKEFAYYFLKQDKLFQFVEKLSQRSSGQTGVDLKELNQYPLYLPPTLAEQKAIAKALSDVDALISNLDKLITKKKAVKQGAMQQLLKSPKQGGKRLPGFEDEWEEIELGELALIRKGQLITADVAVAGVIPVIAGGRKPAYYHNTANRFGKTITVSASGASAGYVSLHSIPIFASDCSTIEEAPNYSIEFLYYLLKFKQQEIYYCQSGGAQPHIHPIDLYPIKVPNLTIEEQVSIAKILFDMDAEIEKLEKKKAKYQRIKQGMMQELLTGKTRLV